jgi:Beta/Gamma crystallin
MAKMLWAVAMAGLVVAGSAQAQPFGAGSATLYELPNFQGRSVTITQSAPDLGDWRFNDRAQSARFEGRWRVCEHDQFRGRCQEVIGSVADLTTYGLMAQISSMEPAGRPGGGRGGGPPGGGYPGRPGRDERGTEGTRTVFFPRPTLGGVDVAAGGRGADSFCRRQGLGPAVWYDSGERASQAVGPDGEYVGRSTVLRDLLCRKY